MVIDKKEGGCEFGRIKFEEIEKRIKDLSSGCDWGRSMLNNLDKKTSKLEQDLEILEGRVWKLIVGLQVFTIILNIILVVLK